MFGKLLGKRGLVTSTRLIEKRGLVTSTRILQFGESRIFASPLARKIAGENGVDLSGIQGSGPKGRIVKADIENAMTSGTVGGGNVVNNFVGGFIDRPVTNDTLALAKQFETSKHEIPHYYLNTEIDISKLLKLREELNQDVDEENQISVNDFILRASALSMSKVPEVNSSWGETFIRQYDDVDINVATVDEAGDETIMPVIRQANLKGIGEIAQESKLLLDSSSDSVDYGVGTFTVTNLGSFGVKTFTPIVRQPQACSLGVGTINKRAVPADTENGVEIITNLTVTLSCDHRVVDGAVSAVWLQHFKTLLTNPTRMLL